MVILFTPLNSILKTTICFLVLLFGCSPEKMQDRATGHEPVKELQKQVIFDGKSFDGQKTIEDYNLIIDTALDANITLSTIAIGATTDEEMLAYLAERGRGRSQGVVRGCSPSAPAGR